MLDFTEPHRTHWVLDFMRQIFGDIKDRFLLSMIFDGVRCGINTPRQMRVAPKLERMDGRAVKVGTARASRNPIKYDTRVRDFKVKRVFF